MSYRVPYGAPSLGLKIDLFLSAVLVRGKARQTYHKEIFLLILTCLELQGTKKKKSDTDIGYLQLTIEKHRGVF